MKKILILLSLFLFSFYGFSQSHLISAGGTVNASSGEFFDSGDEDTIYGNNEQFTRHGTLQLEIPCQQIVALLDTTACVPQPNDSNYFNVCYGQPVQFVAFSGTQAFPENNTLYHQDSATTTYFWDFGDGTSATGVSVTHTYTQVRGYNVTLTITDTLGCQNSNTPGIRVRISPNPLGHIQPLPDVCLSSDPSDTTFVYNSFSALSFGPTPVIQSASQQFNSTMFIPDGSTCITLCYNTGITFNIFDPGATITSAADILSVVVSIEHSFAGDLGFRLICPNGQSVLLDGNDHGGGADLGIANHNDNADQCDENLNPPGTPWVYGWSSNYPQQGSLNALDQLASPVPATDTIVDTGYLSPDQSFSYLIGCPLNGTWNIEICDNWGIDNGYIFMWELNLHPSLISPGLVYNVPIDTVIWSGSFFSIINDTTMLINPDSAGTFPYSVTIIDDFGCSYDSSFNVEIVQTPSVNIGNDTTICGFDVIQTLDAGPGDVYWWSTAVSSQTIPVTTTGYYTVTVTNYNNYGILACFDIDTIFIVFDTCAAIGPDLPSAAHEVTVLSNPTPGEVTLNWPATLRFTSAVIYDNRGRKLFEVQTHNDQNVTIDLSSQQAGLYFIQLTGEQTVSIKVIKE